MTRILAIERIYVLQRRAMEGLRTAHVFRLILDLRDVGIAFFLRCVRQFCKMGVLFTVLDHVDDRRFRASDVIRTLFISGMDGNMFLATLSKTFRRIFNLFTERRFGTIPLLNGFFLPNDCFLDLNAAINDRRLRAFNLLSMRLIMVIIRLALRYVIKDGLYSKILSDLRPAFEVSLLITYVRRQRGFLLGGTMSDDNVRLILVFLILMDALFNRYPANAFAVTFRPPTIRCKRICGAIRRHLLTKDAKYFRQAYQDIRPSVRA